MPKFLLILVVAGSLVAAGCGRSDLYPVSGEVKFDGEAIPHGYITFEPEDRSIQSESARIVDGKYVLQLKPGKYQVKVDASRPVGPADSSMGEQREESYIPEKYNLDTILSEEVDAETENVFDFDLEG